MMNETAIQHQASGHFNPILTRPIAKQKYLTIAFLKQLTSFSLQNTRNLY
jgi:hypothetical protein